MVGGFMFFELNFAGHQRSKYRIVNLPDSGKKSGWKNDFRRVRHSADSHAAQAKPAYKMRGIVVVIISGEKSPPREACSALSHTAGRKRFAATGGRCRCS